MLVESRKSDQSVVVGNVDGLERLIRVTVIEIGRHFVKLGFEADKDIAIYPEEVWQRLVVDRPTEARPTANEALDQWADDGGAQGIQHLLTGGHVRDTGYE